MNACTCFETVPSGPIPFGRPVSEEHRTAHIRAAFGARHGLPKVDEATLASYYRYLSKQISLPMAAWYPEPTNSREQREYRCTVVELIDPAVGLGALFDGIFCNVRKGRYEMNLPLIELELAPDDPNYELVEQYWFWFWHWR